MSGIARVPNKPFSRPNAGGKTGRSGVPGNNSDKRSINLQVAHPEKLQLVKQSTLAAAPLKAAPKSHKFQK